MCVLACPGSPPESSPPWNQPGGRGGRCEGGCGSRSQSQSCPVLGAGCPARVFSERCALIWAHGRTSPETPRRLPSHALHPEGPFRILLFSAKLCRLFWPVNRRVVVWAMIYCAGLRCHRACIRRVRRENGCGQSVSPRTLWHTLGLHSLHATGPSSQNADVPTFPPVPPMPPAAAAAAAAACATPATCAPRGIWPGCAVRYWPTHAGGRSAQVTVPS